MESAGNILKYIKILNENNINYTKDKISCISYLIVITYNTYKNVYNFNNKQWIIYYIGMFLAYMFIWNVLIYNIEKLIS